MNQPLQPNNSDTNPQKKTQKTTSHKESPDRGLHEYSAGFIVFRFNNEHQREYLILHYPGGHFDFPKGHLEEGETEREAALRELEEETGIKNIECIEDFEHKIEYHFYRGSAMITKTVTFFLAKSNETDVTLSHEHQGSIWLPYEEALEKVTFENARHVLRESEKKLHSSG
jgi:bis(5'-nucleosidyl)-tetraphosphatase